MRKYDECSGLVFRHPSACLGDVVDGFAVRHAGDTLAQNPVHYLASLGAVHVSVAQADQELSDLRLEYDYECYHSDVKDRLHYRGHQPHVECRHQHPDQVQGHDRHEYAHGRRSSQPFEGEEDDKSEQEYVQNVGKRHLEKSEKR